MKKWGLLITVFYILALIILTMPLVLFFWHGESSWSLFNLYSQWGYWLVIAVMGIGQLLLLFVPIQIAERKLKSRRPLFVPVITAGFMVVILISAVVTFITFTLLETQYQDFGSRLNDKIQFLWNGYIWIFLILLAWVFWSVVFYRFTKNLEPDRLICKLVSWLLKGSILELLIAVPCHIFVRHRKDCCAPLATFWGIAAGIAIMLLSFGPGIYFLCIQRYKRSLPGGANQSS